MDEKIMFEQKLRNILEHFDYEAAIKIWNAVNEAEQSKRYQVTDKEDNLYWKLDVLLDTEEKFIAHANNNKQKKVERGDVIKIYD